MRQIIIPYLSEAITALVAAFAGWFFTRRKSRAESDKSELDVVEEAIKIWREIAQDLKKEIQELKEENKLLKHEVSRIRVLNNKIFKALDKLNIENFGEVIKELRIKVAEHE